MDKEELFQKHFEKDLWGLANILKAADRRIGIRRLLLLRKKRKINLSYSSLKKD
ncbi:hypothetical protein LEP1GSC074_0366 [Leptospira noguchii str. Hook]|nr:hypothetical protein LEP1GSC074_0366 [Leptospira noguchii str. Hook]